MSIHPTAIIEDGAELASSVEIGPYAVIGVGVTLRENVRIGAHSVVQGPSDIGAGTQIFHHAVIGEIAQDLKYNGEAAWLEIGERNVFREFTTVNRGTEGGTTRIGNNNLFMAYSHVAHDATIGNHCVFANAANIAGQTRTIPSAIYTYLNQPGGEDRAIGLVAVSLALALLALIASEWSARRLRAN